jgi:tRNA(Ile)-lysidine synthase
MRLQDLPRPLARRCLGIPRFCRDMLGVDLRGARLVVAYSAGHDSTALLHLLHLLRPSLGLTLVAAHAHHGLRPESDQEQEQALAVCTGLRVPCQTRRLELTAQHGLEEEARIGRYAFLEDVRAMFEADWIVTAHHADDLAEDIVMRLVRGTGWPGLGGMPGRDDRRRVLRPVLDWEKNELAAVLDALGLAWCEDASNRASDRTRNRVRHEVLPLLRRENPALTRAALNLWRCARVDEDYWSRQKATAPSETGGGFLDADTLQLHPAHRLRLYKTILDAMGPGQALAEHLLGLDKAWEKQKHGHQVQFPGDKVACIESGGIRFTFQPRRTVSPESAD